MKKIKIYFAAPLFSKAEQDFNATLAYNLEMKGFEVFLPQEKGKNKIGRDLFKICVMGLDAADLVIAILDGADADSGTCWECGYAYAKNIPVIGLRTDFRVTGDTGGFNSMIYLSSTIINEPHDLMQKLLDAIKKVS
jgi:nucleoside 2-deoxyribosyltransferase